MQIHLIAITSMPFFYIWCVHACAYSVCSLGQICVSSSILNIKTRTRNCITIWVRDDQTHHYVLSFFYPMTLLIGFFFYCAAYLSHARYVIPWIRYEFHYEIFIIHSFESPQCYCFNSLFFCWYYQIVCVCARTNTPINANRTRIKENENWLGMMVCDGKATVVIHVSMTWHEYGGVLKRNSAAVIHCTASWNRVALRHWQIANKMRKKNPSTMVTLAHAHTHHHHHHYILVCHYYINEFNECRLQHT